jgi:hypothetical protein
VQGAANLTTSFGQSLSAFAIAVVAATPMSLKTPWLLLAATALAFCAFVSHTSSFEVLAFALFFIAALYTAAGIAPLRSAGLGTFVVLAAAGVLAFTLYYAHFPGVYRGPFNRISAPASDTSVKIDEARPSGPRAVLGQLHEYFGVPLLALAALGARRLVKRGLRDRLGLALAAWLLAWLAVLLFASPIEMRHHLAAFLPLAILAGFGAAWGWRARPLGPGVTIALLVWIVFIATRNWLRWL